MLPPLRKTAPKRFHNRIGLKHATSQAENSLDPVAFNALAPQFLVRACGAKQHALGHDDAGAPAGGAVCQRALRTSGLLTTLPVPLSRGGSPVCCVRILPLTGVTVFSASVVEFFRRALV